MAGMEFESRLDADSDRRLRNFVESASSVLDDAVQATFQRAGANTVDEITRTVQETTPGGSGLRAGGVRDTLAGSTKASIQVGPKTRGIRIETSGDNLPAAKAEMAKAYNKKTWRHPVGGAKGETVEQQGRPYFGTVIAEAKNKFEDAARESLEALGESADEW